MKLLVNLLIIIFNWIYRLILLIDIKRNLSLIKDIYKLIIKNIINCQSLIKKINYESLFDKYQISKLNNSY